MNTYHVFFGGKKVEVEAETSLGARDVGIAALRKQGTKVHPSREYMAEVRLVALAGEVYLNSGASLPGA